MTDILGELNSYIDYIHISSGDETLFKWKPPDKLTAAMIDVNLTKEIQTQDVFFHIDKGNRRLVFIRKKNLIYAIGSETNVQFQILEAILEVVDKKFHEMFDIAFLLSLSNVSESMFKNFKDEIDSIISNFKNLNLVKQIKVQCRVCDSMLPLYLKRSFVENADSYPVSIVYKHKGHAILCFIDRNYGVRGIELVAITG